MRYPVLAAALLVAFTIPAQADTTELTYEGVDYNRLDKAADEWADTKSEDAWNIIVEETGKFREQRIRRETNWANVVKPAVPDETSRKQDHLWDHPCGPKIVNQTWEDNERIEKDCFKARIEDYFADRRQDMDAGMKVADLHLNPQRSSNLVDRPRTITMDPETAGRNQALRDLANAKTGDAESRYRTGMNYIKGEFLPVNFGMAMELLVLASRDGHILATHEIPAQLIEFPELPELLADQGIQMPDGQILTSKNINEILAGLIYRSAENGDPVALLDYAKKLQNNEDLAVQELANANITEGYDDASGIAANAYYSLASIYPPSVFLQTESDRTEFQMVREKSIKNLVRIYWDLSIRDAHTTQRLSDWIFQKILRNTRERS